jgi:hypothetical protein
MPVPADWYPVYINKRLWRDLDVQFNFYSTLDESITDCDCLFISSRFFTLHTKDDGDLSRTLEQIASYREKTKVIWFDFRDSTGNTQFEVLPHVDLYLKKQLLKDLTLYQKPLYGNRVYTNYIHEKFSISDSYDESCLPLQPEYEKKLGISWNPGLLDFRGGINPVMVRNLLTDKYESVSKIRHQIDWQNPLSERSHNMLALFSTNYKRETVAWQRKNIVHELRKINDNKIVFDKKVPLAEEISIRKQSKIILSLFGWGEICSRDFQAFIAGSCLVAADTTHLRTWPTTHIPHKTYWPIKWDLSDIGEVYETLIGDNKLRFSLAMAGQQRYKQAWSLEGRKMFCDRLVKKIRTL